MCWHASSRICFMFDIHYTFTLPLPCKIAPVHSLIIVWHRIIHRMCNTWNAFVHLAQQDNKSESD